MPSASQGTPRPDPGWSPEERGPRRGSLITIGRANDATLVLTDDHALTDMSRIFAQDGSTGSWKTSARPMADSNSCWRSHPYRQNRFRAAQMRIHIRYAARSDVGMLRTDVHHEREPEQHRWGWPDPGRPFGAFLYAFLGAFALWLVLEIAPHIHITITWS